MKGKKTKIYWPSPKVLLLSIVLLLIVLVYVVPNMIRPEFKITENGQEVNQDWKNVCIRIPNNYCFSPSYDGIDVLERNCECLEKECVLHYNYSQRANFVDNQSMTWNGPIEFTEDGGSIFYKPGATVIEECGSCQRYQCGNFTIEVIR